MSTAFTTPPQSDFQSCAELTNAQAEHLADLEKWLRDQCLDTSGLTGLLTPMASLVPKVADPVTRKLVECQQGLAGASTTITTAGGGGTDGGTFPAPIPHFPDLRALHLPQVGDFHDEPLKLKEPASATADTDKNMHDDLLALQTALGNGPLGLAEKAFRVCTGGQDLLALLIHPLLGDFGRLKYLHEAYSELAEGTYTIAATTRKGAWALSDEWTGETAVAFDSHMFRWGMGIGGLGDAAIVIGKACRDAYAAVMPLVDTALVAINALVKKELRSLAELVAGDAATMLFGGPANPVADIVALVNTAYRIYESVRLTMLGVHSIRKIYEEISKVIKDVHVAVDKVLHYASQPVQSLEELIGHLKERGFEFEKNALWNAELGVARITMLPSSPGSPAGPGTEDTAGPATAAEPEPATPDDAEVPPHQAIARRIYDRLKDGAEVEEVHDLITEMTRAITAHHAAARDGQLASSAGGTA